MKKQILASLILASLSVSAFALPQSAAQSQFDGANAGSTIVEDGYDRTGGNRIAEDGFDRTGSNRVAEDGFDRTGSNRIAEDGADRSGVNRIS
ncbi:hypothetical protein [Pseudomonas paeninsulae]|uniref:hypothetical protein n=1 Tax=Pseudomonas paeninsulae TaxID=3110772 RepID=UPI002D7873F1|nr:hypothetical protein [Pseudomonas sp. IT1137]